MNLVFRDYAQPGDQMTLTFDPAASKVISLSVNTYMGQEKDAVTLQVQMATLARWDQLCAADGFERHRQEARGDYDQFQLSENAVSNAGWRRSSLRTISSRRLHLCFL